MSKQFRYLVFVLAMLLSASCADKKPEIYDIMLTDEGHFRGISIGDSPEQVIQKEYREALVDTSITKDYQYYDYKLGKHESYAIAYNFEDGHLFDIQVDIYLRNAERSADLFHSFKNYFDKQYGKSFTEEGYHIWNFKTPEGEQVEIMMLDESTEYKNGKISITIFNLDY